MHGAAITGIGEAGGADGDGREHSLESMIFAAAGAALADAGIDRDDLDGIVIAASDQTDGRAISSMLTAGPAGAYLNDEVNVASSPGHALAQAYMQILAGTHRRILVSSWGKASESAGGAQPAERLSAEPFFERDSGLSALAAAALQAQAHRRAAGPEAEAAALAVAARNRPGTTAEQVAASAPIATPLRALEVPPETDGAFSLVLEREGDERPRVRLAAVGWRSDIGRIAERRLDRLDHLGLAAADAYARAGVAEARREIDAWHLHDYTADAELLAYEPLRICPAGEVLALGAAGSAAINPEGGSLRGEAPFGGPLRKALEAVRGVRSGQAGRAVAQISTGFAGQFQTVAVIEAGR
ncbi:MAG: hypothetical protein R2725_05030 [Solirubrobacterales bacterium]